MQEIKFANESVYIVSIILAEDKITQEIEKCNSDLSYADRSTIYYDTNNFISKIIPSGFYHFTKSSDISQTLSEALKQVLSEHVSDKRFKAARDVTECYKVACMKFKETAPKDELIKAFRDETQRLLAKHLANLTLARQ